MFQIIKKIMNSNSKILVVGDFIFDYYVIGKVLRKSFESGVPVLTPHDEKLSLGGAANVYKIINMFNKNVDICTVLGNDERGQTAKEMLIKSGNKESLIYIDENRRTTFKTRFIENDINHLIRVDEEDIFDLSEKLEHRILEDIKSIINEYDVVVLSDYGKGIITHSLSKALIKICDDKGKPVIVDPNSNDISKYRNAYMIKANANEFMNFVNKMHRISYDINLCIQNSEVYANELLEKSECEFIYVTLGENGGILFNKNHSPIKIQAKGGHALDVTGAGDTVISSIALALAACLSVDKAIELSSYMAGACIKTFGTDLFSREGLYELIQNNFNTIEVEG